jgi:hypothetical protein
VIDTLLNCARHLQVAENVHVNSTMLSHVASCHSWLDLVTFISRGGSKRRLTLLTPCLTVGP